MNNNNNRGKGGGSFTRSFVCSFIYDCLLIEYPVHNAGRPLSFVFIRSTLK